MLPKINVTSKKDSNKSCSELNFIQKSPQVHMCIPPPHSLRVELGAQKSDIVETQVYIKNLDA